MQELLLSQEKCGSSTIEDEEIISQWLSQKKGQKVKLVVPQKGDKERLVELAARNAALVLTQDEEKIKREELRTIGAMTRWEAGSG